MVARTRLNVTSYVLWLSFSFFKEFITSSIHLLFGRPLVLILTALQSVTYLDKNNIFHISTLFAYQHPVSLSAPHLSIGLYFHISTLFTQFQSPHTQFKALPFTISIQVHSMIQCTVKSLISNSGGTDFELRA